MKLRSSFVYGTHDERLLLHINRHEDAEAQAIIQRNPNVLKLVDTDGYTLLHQAAEMTNGNMVQYLINSGIDVNIQDRQGRTALMIVASFFYKGDLIKKLLEANAYVHLRDSNGESGLQTIVEGEFRYLDIGILCLRNLMSHYSNDYDKLAKLFLECVDPLLQLLFAGQPMLTRFVLEQGYPVDTVIQESCSYNGQTPLQVAVHREDLEHVKVLIEFGADVNGRGNTMYPPLGQFRESHRGSKKMLKILEILLSRGALTTTVTEYRCMPVEFILLYGGREEIRLLLRYGLHLRAKDRSNQTVLHLLAMNDCENILEELQGMDFDVKARDYEGRTPLHRAIGNRSSVDFLLKNGADVNASDNNGLTPLHIAFNLDNEYQALGIPCTCDVRIIELLLESGADPQAGSMKTAFEEAVYSLEVIAMKPVYAHLAMLKARGAVIKKCIESTIDIHRLIGCFDFYVKELEQTKSVNIWGSITLYDLLTKREDQLEICVRNRELALKLVRISKKYIPESNYYYNFVRRRMVKIFRNAQMKSKAAVIVCELMNLHHGASHIISDAILNYLSNEDLWTLIKLHTV